MSTAQQPWPEHVDTHEQARDIIIRALYAGITEAVDGDTAKEKMMALALHYSDTLVDQKQLLKQAYNMLLYAPHVWPASHVWEVAGRWLKIIGLHTNSLKDAWRTTVLMGLSHRIVQAWFEAECEDDFLQALDDVTTQIWGCMENGFL